jgi:glucose 1-dehydrogenase
MDGHMRNQIDLTGQVALVTGGDRGIGRAIVGCLARSGATVVLSYRSKREKAEQAVQEIEQGGGRAMAIHADVSSEHDVQTMFAAANKAYGRVHCVVANAGIDLESPLVDTGLEDWQKQLGVDLTGTFLCAREALRGFHEWSNPDLPPRMRGTIIAITSVHDRIPFGGHGAYCAAKAGAAMLMRTIALEEGPRRIRAISVAPGAIATDINREVWEDPAGSDRLMEVIPHNRIGATEEIGRAVAWLASDDASYITGTTLVVDGGMTCYPSFADNG